MPIWSMPIDTPEGWAAFMDISQRVDELGGGHDAEVQAAREMAPQFFTDPEA